VNGVPRFKALMGSRNPGTAKHPKSRHSALRLTMRPGVRMLRNMIDFTCLRRGVFVCFLPILLSAVHEARGEPPHLGESLYLQRCAECHHPNRVGISAPPLLPGFLRKKSDEELIKVTREGLPATKMPAYPDLTDSQLKDLAAFMRSDPGDIKWTHDDIKKSLLLEPPPATAPSGISDLENLTAVVERGTAEVWRIKLPASTPDDTGRGQVGPNDHVGRVDRPGFRAVWSPDYDGSCLAFSSGRYPHFRLRDCCGQGVAPES
jgi:mono/diheme cytochrome c family protein